MFTNARPVDVNRTRDYKHYGLAMVLIVME